MSQIESLTDEKFMDVIREYPAIYERSSPAFRDKNKRSNSWRHVAEATNMDIQSVVMAKVFSLLKYLPDPCFPFSLRPVANPRHSKQHKSLVL